ncbi:uncharacterized protein LOC119654382 isoform X3 [Hermetia illucens]|uniref:uncharacterized protein LOC119654382 isoform X3 n=1 Tax=Hermetia illucens TaxID=343691 RepID=UPI0018CC19D1|nr:uncharacterized protein LOC119654382 isoform X3 [Hermetia illucens]
MSELEEKPSHQPTSNADNIKIVIIAETHTENEIEGCDKKPQETTTKIQTNELESCKESESESKSILSDSSGTAPRKTVKKSVSFDPGDEKLVKKFIEGEVIVDKQNPFKNGGLVDVRSVDKVLVAKPRRESKPKVANESDFVTTEDVLRESKYVTTYIKNPDKVFKYDPAVIARIKLEELREIQAKKPMRKKVLTKQTQDRLKEIKNKYNNLPPNLQAKPVKGSSRDPTLPETKIPKYKKVSKSNYPDLSQIKVKTGTDLDETFQLNPEEVVFNAKRFDDRIKTLKISSEDELDDIEEPLTSIEDTYDEVRELDSNQKPEEHKGTFTNTVNSTEFKEFLNKKGLVLTPREKLSNGNAKTIHEEVDEVDAIQEVSSTKSLSNMESKKEKKPSVLHRLFRPSIFSSKRKTNPKEPVPTPQNLYSNTTVDSGKPTANNIKRVVLERQSFHGSPTDNNKDCSDLRKQIEQSRKSYGGDDRSSSISSALTNAEDYPDDHSVDSIRQSEPAQPQVQRVADRQPIRVRQQKLRESLSSSKPLVPSRIAENGDEESIKAEQVGQKPVPAIRRTIERQSLIERKPLFSPSDENRNFRRSVSMDRQEINRRTQIPVKSTPSSSRLLKSDSTPGKSLSIPRSSKENQGPRMTSTPLQNNAVARQNITPVVPVPIKPAPLSTSSLNVSTTEWNKLRELQERTDMELYMRSQQVPQPQTQTVKKQESIYETVPNGRAQAKLLASKGLEKLYAANTALNPNFVRGSTQRNTYNGGGYESQNFKVPAENVIRARAPQRLPPEAVVQMSPYRSQSVLDEMIVPRQQVYGSIGNTPVVMRKKSGGGPLTKEEIMSRVREFCRRSMNRTPTKLDEADGKTKADVSPVSYASVGYQGGNTPQILAPQVPQRVHSLARQPVLQQAASSSPIYAHVIKRGSLQSNSSDVYYSPTRKTTSLSRPRVVSAGQGSDTDSVFLPPSQQPASPNRIAVVANDNRMLPPSGMQHRGRSGSEVFARNPYAMAPVRTQISKSHGNIDGRSTPLILMEPRPNASPVYSNMTQQQQHNRAYLAPRPANMNNGAHLRVNEQLYRPASALAMAYPQHAPQYSPRRPLQFYESESGSEAGEIQRIMQGIEYEEDWQNDKSGRNQTNEQASDDRRRGNRREDPRRHTLGSDMLQYGGQGQPQQRAVDLEMGTRAQKNKKAPPIRGYTPINQGPLFDEDPGIMSEVETASTGFRRGGKQRSSLPVVRTPSKTLERPLGLVFLQYRSETKRALLPNEITSIDTVRALFVRSFPRQLTMAYLEGPNVKIYIHDASKDMFYELEDVRSHLREIRDRSVLRLFESNEVAAPQVLPGGPGVPQPLPQSGGGHWDQDQSYFSEPEFDSEYQHQHIHKSKGSKPAPYYVAATQTLPRSMYTDRNKNAVGAPAKPLRSYGSRGSMGPPFPYPPDQLYSIPDGYTSSPERGTRGGYEEPYYSQYGTRGSTVTPIIDEEQRCDGNLTDDQYSLYGMKVPSRIPRTPNQLYDPTRPEDLHRIRVEHMERQLANLTGLVQKALNQNPQIIAAPGAINSNYLGVPGQCRGDKSVSFEKSVSFSDDIQGVPKSHSPQHAADTKPPKPAIKSSTLPRTSSQERDRLKPPPPPKPIALASTHPNYRPDIALAPEVYNHLRGLQKKAKDLRMEVRTLRRLSQAQAVAVREDIKDTFMRIRATLLASSGSYWGQGDQERTRLSREEELYKQEVIRLEKDLSDLETSVEGLRGEVINRRTRVNMAAVEDMALVLSRASKTVAELKMKFPSLQQGVRNILATEMEKVVREEKFLKDEPDRLESALRRCKKLTGTLVTLKRLASVQEQRLPAVEPVNEDPPRSAEISSANKPIPSPRLGTVSIGGGVAPENALDALLDELQTFAKPQSQQEGRPDDSTSDDSSQTLHNTITTQHSQSNLFPTNDVNTLQVNAGGTGSNLVTKAFSGQAGNLRRLHSYPSGSDTDTSPPQPSRPIGKPPVPERNADLLSKVGNKRIPPPPPPRTSSRSPLASPTSPNVPHRLPSVCESDQMGNGSGSGQDGSGNSSGNESGNDHVQRQLALEMRHQELLKKQKMLQEQYARLQQMSKNSIALPPADVLQLKKTGSESNLPQKMGLNMTATGSMKNLNADINVFEKNEKNLTISTSSTTDNNNLSSNSTTTTTPAASTTNKVYETDIL